MRRPQHESAACSCFKHGSGGMHGGGEHYYDGCGALKVGTEMSGGVENVLFELDQENEWYFHRPSSTLYLWPNASQPPAALVAPHLETLIDAHGRDHRQ